MNFKSWNLANNCNIVNKTFNMNGFNITSFNSGNWTIKNVTINNVLNFDMNSSGTWNIFGYPKFELTEA